MKRSVLASLVTLLVAFSAQAITYEVKVALDTDRNASTGCTLTTSAGSFTGVEQVLVTRSDVPASGPATTLGTTRQVCAGGTLGSPVPADTHTWGAGFSTSGNLFIETHIATADLGMGSAITPMRVAFLINNGAALNDAVLTNHAGGDIVFPRGGRERAVAPTGRTPHSIVLDGLDPDWSGISAIAGGGGGTPSLRIINGYAFGTSTDIFFALRAQANVNAPTARPDNYNLPTVGGTLTINSASGVMANDTDPNGLPLTAILVAGPQHGTLTLASNGGFTYVHDGSSAPIDTFEYKVSNGTLESNVTQVQIGIGAGGGPQPPPTPKFTSPDHTTFTAGTSNSFTIITTPAHPTSTITKSGSTPAGVTFTDNGDGTATLAGVPNIGTGGVYQFGLTATNVVGSATQLFTLTVQQGPAFTSANNTTFTVGTAGTFTVTTTGFPAPGIVRSGTLPAGVSFTDNSNGTATLAGTPQPNTGGIYTLLFTASNPAGSASQTFTLTVNQAPSITTAAQNQTVCAGQTASFTAAASGFPTPTVQWQVSTNGGGSFSNIPGATNTTYSFTANASDSGNQYRAVFTNSVGTTNSTATLTVNVPPTVTVNPVSQTICAGAPVTFTAAATATPAATVQWQVSTDGGANFTNLAGETATSLTFTTAANQTGNRYRAAFTNACGTATTTAAILTVNVAPTVTSHPAAQTVCAGATATFTVAATGTPAPTIQWQVSTDGGTNFGNLAGETNTTLSFATTAGQNGNLYRAVLTNSCSTVNSNPALLTVNTAPVVTVNPVSQTICAGASASFTAAASANPAATVQWQVDSGSGFSNIPGATSTTLTFTTTAGQTGNQYRAVFTNVCSTATTTAATLTVNVAPAVVTQPTNQIVCAGATATFTAAASGTPAATIQWQVDSGSGFTDIPGATSGTLSFSTVAGDNGKSYRAVFTNSCGVATSNAATLRVDTLPVVSTNPITQTICAGAPVTFTAAASSNAGQTVQWQSSPDGVAFTDIPGETNLSLTFITAAGDNGKQYRAVFTNACGSVNTTAATLVVDTLPVVTTNPVATAVCDGGTANFTAAATSNANDHTVQWQSSPDGVTFTDIPGATTTTLSFTVASGDNGKQYRAVFTNACGSVNTTAATLTVNTAPVVTTNPSSQTVCAGANATFTAAASGQPTATVQWQVSTDGITFNDIPGATSTTLSFATAAGDNGKQYRARFSNTCGTNVATTAATLTVDTLPVVTTNPLTQTVCAGGTATFTAAATSNASNHTVQWQSSPDGVTFTNIPGATSTTLSFATATGDNGKQYRAVFTTSCGSTNTTAATLTVDTLPVVTTNPLPQTVCAGATATFTAAATSNASNHTVQWQSSPDGVTFTDIPGATSTTLSFAAAAGDNGKQYRAVFTTSCGSTNTTAATLTVDTLPVVTTNPLTQTVCAGATATFTAAATSNASNHTVQWQSSPDGVTFTDIPGATSTTLSFTAANGDNGKQYRAVFTTSCGSTNTTAATLTVDTLPVVTTNPLTQTVCAGATATFTAAATSNAGNHTVQWQSSPDGVIFTDIPGATSTTLSFATAAGDNGKQYRAVFTTSCGSTNTTAATLTVDTLPVVTTNPLTQTVCAGATATFTAAATSNASNHTVQWQSSPDGVTFTDIPGATSTTLSFTAANGDNGKQYRAVFTTSCGSTNTTAATLTVDSLPVVTTDPVSQAVCAGATATFTAAATSNASNHTVQWQSSPDGVTFTNIPGETSTTLSFTAAGADNGKQYRAVFTTSCGSTNSAAATLTVNTPPAVTLNPTNQTVCENTTATFTATASGNPAPTVQWQVSTDGGANFNDIPGATSTTLSFTAVIADNTKQYRAVFTNSCSTATTTAATLTVNTTPAVTTHPLTQTVQSGNPVTFTAAATGTPSPTVQWQVSTDGGTNFNNIVGQTTTTLTFTAQLSQSGNQYRAVFTNSCGTATTNAATLTVTCPTITVTRNPSGSFPNAVFNSAYTGESVIASGGTGPYTFQVTAGALPTNLALATNGTLSGTPNVTGVFNFTVTATDVNGCPGSQAFTISVGPNVLGESYNDVGNTQLIAFNFTAPGTPHVLNTTSLLANDTGPAGTLAVAVVTDAPTAQLGGKITTMADGSFSYTPPVGFTGTDSYNYTVTSNGVGAQATVQFVVAGKVWYVKNDHGVPGTGVSSDPFQRLAGIAPSAENSSAAGDTIYVHTGNGNTLNQNAGITLKTNQVLHGAGEGVLTVGAITINTPGAGTKPLIGNTTGAAITLANGNTLKGFTATTTTGATLAGIFGTALTAGPAISNVNVGPATGAGLNITASNTITTSLTNVAISGAGTTGIDMDQFGTLTINSGVTVSGVQALRLTGPNTVAGNTVNGTFGTVTATGGTNGIALTHIHGTIAFPAGSALSGASGDEFLITGNAPSVNVTYQGNITYGGAASAINITAATGINASTITFNTGTLSVTGGTAISVGPSSGTHNYYVGSGTATIGGVTGINLGTNANGTYAFGTNPGTVNFTITNTTGTSFNVSSNEAKITYNGSISQAVNAATLVNFSSHSSAGNATFQNGTLTASTGNGIVMSNADAAVTYSGVVTLSGTAGVVIRQGSGGTINFSNTSSSITSTGTPFTVRGDAGGGNNPAVNGVITYSGTINKTSTGTLLDVNTLSGSLTFNGSQLSGATNGGPGVIATISNVTGTLTTNHLSLDSSNNNFGPATLVSISGTNTGGTMTFHHMVLSANGTSAQGAGLIASGGGTVTVTNTGGNSSITVRNAVPLSLTGVAIGTSAINNVTISSGGANTTNGVVLSGVTAGSMTIAGGSLVGVNTGGVTFDINNSPINVSYGGTITANSSRAVRVNNTASGACGGTITFSGAITGSGASATGILVNNCNAGAITFSNATKTLSTQANAAVTLTNNTGTASISFTNGTLLLTTTTGAAFTSTGAGAVTVSGSGNVISTTTGTAFSATNSALTVTLQSVTQTGGTQSIILTTTSGSFSVSGTSGGLATGTGGSISGVTTRAIHILNSSGTASFSSMNVAINTLAEGGVLVDNNTSGNMTVNFTGCAFSGVTASVTQNKALVQYESGATSNLTGNVQNCYFNGSRTYGFFANGVGNSVLNVTVNQSGFGTNVNSGAPVNKPGSSITNAPAFGLGVVNGGAAAVTYAITNNTFWGASGTLGAVYAVTISGGAASGSSNGSFTGNQIGKAGTAGSGCTNACAGLGILPGNGGSYNITINNNDIRQTARTAIDIFNSAGTSSPTVIAKITNNTIAEPDTGAPTSIFHHAVRWSIGNSAGGVTAGGCLQVANNNISGAWTAASVIRITTLNTTGITTIPGLSPNTGATGAQVDAYIEGLNGLAAGTVNTTVGGPINNTAGSAPCP
jgi:large repetitive protein